MRFSYFVVLLLILSTSTDLRAEDATLASGGYFTCSLLQDGMVQCWGDNDDGQLGTGLVGGKQPTPQAVPNLSGVIALGAGRYHICALQQGGMVQCWGDNYSGQLGRGIVGGEQPTSESVPGLSNVIALGAGSYHTCALEQDGTVECWGENDDGQLGMGMAGGDQPTPQSVPGLSNVIALSVGNYHTCALQQGGTVQCWGDNGEGQLGTGTVGGNQSTPQQVAGLSDAIALSAGNSHTCALRQGGTVQCWGYNGDGQLGTEVGGIYQAVPQEVSGLADVIALSAGDDYACALELGGTMQCWGDNNYGQLGTGMYDGDKSTPQPVAGLGDVTAVSAGASHACAWQQSGSIQCWGDNRYGQLGTGIAGDNQSTPATVLALSNVTALSAGRYHTCALEQAGTVQCWGDNRDGQLGTGMTGGYKTTPQPVPDLPNVIALSAGDYHTCALEQGGTVQCWGDNLAAQLGNGVVGAVQLSPQPVTDLDNVISISAGRYHTCALQQGGTVQCWGHNGEGQLGTGIISGAEPNPQAVSGLTDVVAIRAGDGHTCALQQSGSVQCWGSNEDGQLGFAGADSTDRVLVPMGGATVLAIAAGGSHNCAAVQGPFPQPTRIVCWGRDDEGQVGNGPASSEDVPSPVPITNATPSWLAAGGDNACFYSLGTAYCWGGNEFGLQGRGVFASSPAPTNSPGFSTATAMDLGANHACAIQPDKTVICAGSAQLGQLGNGQFGYSATPLVVGRVFANGFEENP